MASSVPSERASSPAGITITKHRNRLKAGIAEALQPMKCSIRKDLVCVQPAPPSILELSPEVTGDNGDPEWCDEPDPKSCDAPVINH